MIHHLSFAVLSAWRNPVNGFIDSFFGPTVYWTAILMGQLRTIPMTMDAPAHTVPVDMCANAIIASAWAVSKERRTIVDDIADVPVYNFCPSADSTLSWGEFFALAAKYGLQYPAAKAMWCLAYTDNRNAFWDAVYRWSLHIVPAALCDAVALLLGKQPGMLQMYKKLHRSSAIISSFPNLKWQMDVENMHGVRNALTERDRELFDFDVDAIDQEDYMKDYILGIRKFLLKDSFETVTLARKRSVRFQRMYLMIKIAAVTAVAALVYYAILNLI